MIERMKALVREKGFCVMATVSGEEPHCSLMSYAVDDDCRDVYMITDRQTKKYRNLTGNGTVSLLVDSREEDRGTGEIQALTMSGEFRKIESADESKAALARLLKRHPRLKPLADMPGVEVFAIRIRSFQLLEGISDSYFAAVD